MHEGGSFINGAREDLTLQRPTFQVITFFFLNRSSSESVKAPVINRKDILPQRGLIKSVTNFSQS